MIYPIRVTSGQEKMTAEILAKKARAEKLPVYAITNIENVKGYIFVEALDENAVAKLIQKIKHVKGFLKKPVDIKEIENLIKTVNEPTAVVEVGDIVEMTAGPFKGEKAKVTKTDPAKDQVTVELIEVAVPIPITVKTKIIKLFQKSKNA
jgi:transcriptional antiterminator NusG